MSHVPHPHLPHLGRESDSSLNRASEKSDSLVRSTYDKAADTAGAVKDKAQGAAGSIKGNVKGAASAVEDKARSLTHSSKDTGKDISKCVPTLLHLSSSIAALHLFIILCALLACTLCALYHRWLLL